MSNIFITEEQAKVIKDKLKLARNEVNTDPTEGQKKAGNYKMGHVTIKGFDITIENPKGSIRRGVDKGGKKWEVKMNNDYGYFRSTLGKDGDAIDCFIGPDFDSEYVFAIDQNIDGKFDETKVMLCFKNSREAKKAYMSNYSRGWKGFSAITKVTMDVFKKWLYDGYRQRKPFHTYVQIKQSLNESTVDNFKLQEWEKEAIKKHEKNGIVTLYHNTSNENLEDILNDGELANNMHHTEGHGDSVWFTFFPDSWRKQSQISIEVPVEEFVKRYDGFKLMNSDSVVSYKNVPLDKYKFKITIFDGLPVDVYYNLMERKGDDYIYDYFQRHNLEWMLSVQDYLFRTFNNF